MVASWRRMTSRSCHGLGTAGPPRPLRADTPVTWVTKLNNQRSLITEHRMGGFAPNRESRLPRWRVRVRACARVRRAFLSRQAATPTRTARAAVAVAAATLRDCHQTDGAAFYYFLFSFIFCLVYHSCSPRGCRFFVNAHAS